MKIDRTREHFEQAMQNANCPLFEAIARWVVQDEGYLSMSNLVIRIKELEALECATGIIPLDQEGLRKRQSLNQYKYKGKPE